MAPSDHVILKEDEFIQNQKIELNLLGDLIIAMDGVHGVDGIDKKDRSGRILLKDGKHGESGTDGTNGSDAENIEVRIWQEQEATYCQVTTTTGEKYNYKSLNSNITINGSGGNGGKGGDGGDGG